MKYLRFSLLVGVQDDIDPMTVENDIRDYVEGSFNFVEDDSALPAYMMVVSDISFEGDETK